MRVPLGILSRPFDFLVAFLIFFAGGYGFLDPDWPPDVGAMRYVILIEDTYLTAAGIVIMCALILKQLALSNHCSERVVIPSIVGEMFGWVFVSFAAFSIAVTSWVVPPTALHLDQGTVQTFAWFVLWSLVSAASLSRFFTMRRSYKKPYMNREVFNER